MIEIYSVVIFDLDGTLLDTSSGVVKATDYSVEKFQLPVLNEKQKQSFIGPPVQTSFKTYYNCSEERAWELATAWRNAYKDMFLYEAVAYEGIYELLEYLRECGIKTGVATNKREDYAKTLLEYFSFSPLFDCVIGSDFEGKRTKSDIIRLCMHQCGVENPKCCLMIGDTMLDFIAAQKVGTDFLGVIFGFGFKPFEANEGIITVNSFNQIKFLIENLIKK